MLKRNLLVVAMVAALGVPAVSYGSAQIWFTLDSGDAIGSTGGVDQTLVIDRLDAAQVYNFTVQMWATVSPTGLYSHNTTLMADGAASSSPLMDAAGPPDGSFSFASPGTGAGTAGPGNILNNFGNGTFSGNGWIGNAIPLGKLTLTVDDTSGVPGDISIFAKVGTGSYGIQGGGFETQVFFGPNPAVTGQGAAGIGFGALPIITIREIPEPASLTLFGIGAIALLRRRR